MDPTKASFCERLLNMFNLLSSKKDTIIQAVADAQASAEAVAVQAQAVAVQAQAVAVQAAEAVQAQVQAVEAVAAPAAPVAPVAPAVPDEKHLIEQSLIAENSKYAPDNIETKI